MAKTPQPGIQPKLRFSVLVSHWSSVLELDAMILLSHPMTFPDVSQIIDFYAPWSYRIEVFMQGS